MVRKKQKDNYYIIRLLCSISSNTNDSSLMRLFLSIFLFSSLLNSQINPNNIDIVRDNYGVPHIFAKTDAELAYGLAWANAEDDFTTIQEAYLAGNGMLSKYIGLEGAPADFITQFIGSKEIIDEKIGEITEEYYDVISGYAQGLNSYARNNPDKVLYKKLFPITPKMMMMYSQLQLFISNQGADWAGRILNNDTQDDFLDQNLTGSNVIAMNSNKTDNGETFLAINTHQPLEGPTSWYEVHLNSEEGTNIIGTLYPGTPHVLIGVNENLGWSTSSSSGWVLSGAKKLIFRQGFAAAQRNAETMYLRTLPARAYQYRLLAPAAGACCWPRPPVLGASPGRRC